MFERIKRFYNQGLWKKYQVWDAVGAKVITAEQYNRIVGDTYDLDNRPSIDA